MESDAILAHECNEISTKAINEIAPGLYPISAKIMKEWQLCGVEWSEKELKEVRGKVRIVFDFC